jgi:hypothetical protein
VHYAALHGGSAGVAEATDVSPRGLRVESQTALVPGTRLNLELDDGLGHGGNGAGEVAWCRPRQTPGGRTVYDIGLRLDDAWVRGEGSPLLSALARIFGVAPSSPTAEVQRVRAEMRAGDRMFAITLTEFDARSLRATLVEPETPSGLVVGARARLRSPLAANQAVNAAVVFVAECQNMADVLHTQFGLALDERSAEERAAASALLSALSTASAPELVIEIPPPV